MLCESERQKIGNQMYRLYVYVRVDVVENDNE